MEKKLTARYGMVEVLSDVQHQIFPIHKLTEIFNRVSEDYRPFDINITTDIDVFIAAPFDKRIRVSCYSYKRLVYGCWRRWIFGFIYLGR